MQQEIKHDDSKQSKKTNIKNINKITSWNKKQNRKIKQEPETEMKNRKEARRK